MPGYVDNKDADPASGCAASRARCAGCSGWSTRTRTASTCSTQISAATKALQAVALELLDDHLSHCVAEALTQGGTTADDKIAEASAAIARLVRRDPCGRDHRSRDIGDSLREAFFMFWETLWALILGFTLSGAVQAFVSKERHAAGDGRPPRRLGGAGVGVRDGVVECSYAATAMAKSLFQKGADFISAMVFMFASTNLVIELGVVLAHPDGLAVRRRRVHRRTDHDRAARAHRRGFVFTRRSGRRRARAPAAGNAGGHDHQAMVGVSDERQHELERDAVAREAHVEGRVGRRRELHDGRHQDAAERSW